MRITFDIDTEGPAWRHDREEIIKVFRTWMKLLEQSEQPKAPVKADPKEEKAALDTVKEIIKEPAPKPKKSKAERQPDIQAIKDAVKQQKSGKAPNARKDIDDTLLIYMKDEQHMTLKQIAKELGCCEQTVLNRYNKAKRR